MEPLISVIVPIYNVQEYLEDCIESIVTQTYTNLEIILVDDGSPDDCPGIVDRWAAKDKRIIPIHKENGGQSAARNLGMDIAKGELITFIDGDDWVETEYCSHLYNACAAFDSDITVGGFQRARGGKFYPEKTILEHTDLYYPVGADHAAKYLLERSIALWGKLYKAEVLKEIRLPVGRLAEEYAFQLKALQRAKRMSFCKLPLYNYRIRQNSDAHSIKPRYLMDNIIAVDEALEMCRTSFPFEVDYCTSRLASLLYNYLAAERFGTEETARRGKALDKALAAVGGEEKLLSKIEIPMDTVFYTFQQFGDLMSREEKKKLQKDFRHVFTLKGTNVPKLFGKYLPAYISLPLASTISKKIR